MLRVKERVVCGLLILTVPRSRGQGFYDESSPAPAPDLVGCHQPIPPVHVTASLNDPDDPAIYFDSAHPGSSLVIGTDKGTDAAGRADGAIVSFRPSGELVTRVPLLRPNNVDVEYGLLVGGVSTDVAVTCERNRQMLRVFSLPNLEPIDGGGLPAFEGEPADDRRCMGVGLFRRPRDGMIYATLSRKSGPSGSYLWQYLLEDSNGDGQVEATRVRQFGEFSGEGEIEAVAVDDTAGLVYYSDEACCIRAYAADPEDDEGQAYADELASFGHTGFARDREGISIYAPPASRWNPDDGLELGEEHPGFVFVSDQQRLGAFRVFCREPYAPFRCLCIRIRKMLEQTMLTTVAAGRTPSSPRSS